jgi:hypothetical protein
LEIVQQIAIEKKADEVCRCQDLLRGGNNCNSFHFSIQDGRLRCGEFTNVQCGIDTATIPSSSKESTMRRATTHYFT